MRISATLYTQEACDKESIDQKMCIESAQLIYQCHWQIPHLESTKIQCFVLFFFTASQILKSGHHQQSDQEK